MTRPTPLTPALLALLACLPLLSACTLGGSTSASAENDRLRRQAIDLNDQIAKLKGETDELKAKLAAATKAEGMKPDVIESLPVVTHIEIGGFSGLVPPMGVASGLRIEFYPKDGRNRFVQCVGTVKLEAFLMPADVGAGEPRRLGTLTLDPPALRDAYRSGMLGTYYEAVVPVPPDMADAARDSSILVRVEFMDGTNDQTHKAEFTVSPR